jgi:hypothetical protein
VITVVSLQNYSALIPIFATFMLVLLKLKIPNSISVE